MWFDGKTELHLFFEGVHLRDLHGESVAELDHPARGPANEISPRFVEHIKVVFNRGQRHETAHREAGHVHEETKISHVGHERGILLRFAGRELRFQKREQFHVLAVALGVCGVAFGDGNVLGNLFEHAFLCRVFIEQRATHHDELRVEATVQNHGTTPAPVNLFIRRGSRMDQ